MRETIKINDISLNIQYINLLLILIYWLMSTDLYRKLNNIDFSGDNYDIIVYYVQTGELPSDFSEYKKGRSESVIDQGYSYLSTMLNHKADFILEYKDELNIILRNDYGEPVNFFSYLIFAVEMVHSTNIRKV
jgi:hypothetical protein